MRNTTICYIERDNKYLMLHRIKKDASVDPSHNKWIGVGGKFEKDESPDECIIRETKEETGLELISPKLRGIATFISDILDINIISNAARKFKKETDLSTVRGFIISSCFKKPTTIFSNSTFQ